MFLNKRITDSKSRYWFTELKMTNLIWIFRKIRHIIESTLQFFIIYTNYKAAVKINRQESLFTSFTNKLNFRIIKTFEYIQKFNLIIWHKSGKKHIISDALFRLKKIHLAESNVASHEKLNALFMKKQVNFFSVVEISKDFRDKIVINYQKKLV